MFLGAPLPGPGQVLWTDEDRAFALALLAVEAELCSGCGLPRSQTTDPAMQDEYTADAIRCHCCAAVALAAEPFVKPKDQAGLLFAVRPRNPHRR